MRKILRRINESLIGRDAREERFYCGRCACNVLMPERHYYHATSATPAVSATRLSPVRVRSPQRDIRPHSRRAGRP
jgi:hypothetical protein